MTHAPPLALRDLIHAASVVETAGPVDRTEVTAVEQDHRRVTQGTLFCCVRGGRVDGHDLASQAIERGARSLLCERLLPVDVAQVRVHDVRRTMGPLAAYFHGEPSRALTVVGVTGTNGKTTTTHLVRACLEAAGRPTGLIGTMATERTTPEATDLQRILAGFVAEKKKAAAIEVSSVGLAKHRLDGTWFSAGVFTNLTPDELSIHGSVEAYFEAKASLFQPGRCAVGVVNSDDEWGQRILARAAVSLVGFGRADVEILASDASSTTFMWRGERIRLPLPSEFNVMNAVAAATAAAEVGVEADVIAGALTAVTPLPGHSADVDAGQPFRVVVDFAHSAGALTAVLDSVRVHADGGARVLVVVGCGGDRDPSRRPLMGRAAAESADVVVVTSDNPRHEEPMGIIEEILGGVRTVRDAAADVYVEPDRRAAIALAITSARPGDVVVIAGKGHETGQIIGDETVPFDDSEVALELLGGGSPAGGDAAP